MTPTIPDVAVMALAIGTLSLTITKANIFEWLREWIQNRTRSLSRSWLLLSELVECPYCMSHWVALVVMLLYQPLLLDTGNLWADLGVSWLALVALGSLVAGALLRIFGGVDE